MTGCISFVLIGIASTIAMTDSRVTPSEPISVALDVYSNPVMFLREKRTTAHPYPHRTMVFTGYYRPIRRTNGDQATGVFAQGNAVSGETFFGGMHRPHLKGDPQPIEESKVSSAEAQAVPAPEEEQEYEYHRNEAHHKEKQYHEHHHNEEEQFHHEPHYHHYHHHQDSFTPLGHHEPEQIPLTTEIVQLTEKPITATEMSVTRPKMPHSKKMHKIPVTINADDDDEDEINGEDDEPVVPFVPFKGNKRRQGYPHLNNFFPMIFSFPRLATRGSSGSPPDAITAIANSYSTGKGVASSVATAYGGSSTGKKRRFPLQPYKE